MKKATPIAITRLIDEINNLLPLVNNCNNYASTYDGGTFPYYIMLDDFITVKNQFVYIKQSNFSNIYPFEKRYNLNNKDQFSVNGVKALLYDLRLIKKSFKNLLNNN